MNPLGTAPVNRVFENFCFASACGSRRWTRRSEIAGAVALWAVRPATVARLVALLTQDEIVEDPRDLVANYLRHATSRLSLASEHFVAVYLLGHGIPKILLVAALLKNKVWAYPVAIVVFAAFVVYQLCRFALTHSLGLIGLSVFDVIVICLVWLEYRALKSRARPLR
ncbi:MAG TPA: DUF2127 domain-containing protein [Candidatus Acidoferrales bacterium]|nr:DUF2127 domain-containing protein [Candidatus Acidoferrales bacterium]